MPAVWTGRAGASVTRHLAGLALAVSLVLWLWLTPRRPVEA